MDRRFEIPSTFVSKFSVLYSIFSFTAINSTNHQFQSSIRGRTTLVQFDRAVHDGTSHSIFQNQHTLTQMPFTHFPIIYKAETNT